MDRYGFVFLTLFFIFFSFTLVSNVSAAEGCVLSAELVNQDPYPALPGSYVDILFQLNGIDNDCTDGVSVDLFLEYPFSFDTYGISTRFLESSTYTEYNHQNFWNNVYRIRVDEGVLEGDYEVEFRYKDEISSNWNNFLFTKFNITVDDARVDFEVHISDYNINERNLVFQILNIGNQDIEALTLEIPEQENIIVKGSNRNIVGDLDSNEYTTADFEATPSNGEITIFIYYTDSINERRFIEKKVYYNANYFIDSMENMEQEKDYRYTIAGALLLIIFILFFRKYRVNKKRKNKKFLP